jgi:uncharacterized Fe-S cluster protein YjdI
MSYKLQFANCATRTLEVEGVASKGAKDGCPVCLLPGRERRAVDVALALGHGLAWIARHERTCLGGDALIYEARRRGWIDVLAAEPTQEKEVS